MSNWVETHIACEECGSSDGRSVNDRGWSTCFVCDHKFQVDGEYQMEEKVSNKSTTAPLSTLTQTLLAGVGEDAKGIPDRGISPLTTKRYGVVVQGDRHVYPYYGEDGDVPIAAQKRLPGKVFPSEGPINETQLFGQQLFPPGGRKLLICEGAIDTMSGYQLQGSKYPTVGVKNAPTAVNDCKRNWAYIDSFDEVIFCMDNDKAGNKAAKELGELFGHKARLMKPTGDYNDINDMLMDGNKGAEAFKRAFWDAERYTPEGIIAGTEMWSVVNKPMEQAACQYPYPGLNELTYGVRMGELVTVCAGSGLGKSQWLREVIWHLLNNTPDSDNIGCMFLEENARKTGLSLMSLACDKPLHLPITESTEEERRSAFEATLGTGKLFFNSADTFGNATPESAIAKIRYFAKAMDCKYLFLDHISMLVSGQDGGDERKTLDSTMTKLRTLVQELDIALFVVSHLKRPDGKGHEEGAATSLSQLRGSAAIAQLSDIVIGLERNGQHEDPQERNTTRVRVLKNRFSGETGKAAALLFDKGTGRMLEIPDTEDITDMEAAL